MTTTATFAMEATSGDYTAGALAEATTMARAAAYHAEQATRLQDANRSGSVEHRTAVFGHFCAAVEQLRAAFEKLEEHRESLASAVVPSPPAFPSAVTAGLVDDPAFTPATVVVTWEHDGDDVESFAVRYVGGPDGLAGGDGDGPSARSMRFPGLAAGHYTFTVAARNRWGEAESDEVEVDVTPAVDRGASS